MPTFIIGGAPRSGTTYLCHLLDKHPDVYMAKPFIPEPKVCLMAREEGLPAYRERYAKFFADVKNEKALGEKSSSYFENLDAFKRLKLLFNQIRFLFIVREPVARAYSNYLFTKKNGFEHLSFEEAIEKEKQRDLDDPFPPEMSYVKPFSYLARGDYATFAERYLKGFGKDQVKFVLYEDILLAPDRLHREVQEFIGVDPLPTSKLTVGIVNSTEKERYPIDPRFEQKLREQMRPLVERFAHITGLDVGPWKY